MNIEFELGVLRDEIRDCKKCELCKSQPFFPVPGIGPAGASIMLVGEAPGKDESIAEEPFVGMSGRMLDRLLKGAGLERKSIYICNTVNCRPTDGNKNRTPSRKEITECSGWLFKQIELVKPKVIFTLGRIPTSVVLGFKPTFTLEDYVGTEQKYKDIIVIPNYHPSYLLQTGRDNLNKSIQIFKKGMIHGQA